MKGPLTPARRWALEKLVRFGRVRQGKGMWDEGAPVISPATAGWLLDEGHARGGDEGLELVDLDRALLILKADSGQVAS